MSIDFPISEECITLAAENELIEMFEEYRDSFRVIQGRAVASIGHEDDKSQTALVGLGSILIELLSSLNPGLCGSNPINNILVNHYRVKTMYIVPYFVAWRRDHAARRRTYVFPIRYNAFYR